MRGSVDYPTFIVMKIPMNPAVYLQPTKQGAMRRGHPWIFPKAIAHTKGKLVTGQLTYILGADKELLGVGIYNEHSLYRIRVLAHAFESICQKSLAEIIEHRLQQAIQVRSNLGLPNEKTNAYRLFNSEADGLSGLTIDRFNDTLVVSSTAYWVEENRALIEDCIQKILKFPVIWFAQSKALTQDGWEKSESAPPMPHKTKVLEGGVYYEVDFSNPQKTGLFLDQRENHERVGAIARGKKVLDLYSYTGGFALHAAKGGAQLVCAVDSSEQAIQLAKNNATLNGIEQIEFIVADARDYLVKAGEYDLVILDPPKLVPSQKYLQKAKNYYRFLHREVFKYLNPGSLLLTCNCSSALSVQEFSDLVSAQAMMVGKRVRTLGIYGPASCHPTLAAFPEGQYLTAVLLAIV